MQIWHGITLFLSNITPFHKIFVAQRVHLKGYFPDESIIVKYFYNQVDIYKGLLQPNNFVCTFPFWEKMILKGILFIYNVAPIPYLNLRHVKSGGKDTVFWLQSCHSRGHLLLFKHTLLIFSSTLKKRLI